jgi:hypothetical protein
MLEITGDDIALLSDADLRTLVGLLCEGELRNKRQRPEQPACDDASSGGTQGERANG